VLSSSLFAPDCFEEKGGGGGEKGGRKKKGVLLRLVVFCFYANPHLPHLQARGLRGRGKGKKKGGGEKNAVQTPLITTPS